VRKLLYTFCTVTAADSCLGLSGAGHEAAAASANLVRASSLGIIVGTGATVARGDATEILVSACRSAPRLCCWCCCSRCKMSEPSNRSFPEPIGGLRTAGSPALPRPGGAGRGASAGTSFSSSTGQEKSIPIVTER
jgi:hypothetical protein